VQKQGRQGTKILHLIIYHHFFKNGGFDMAVSKTHKREQTKLSNRTQPVSGKKNATMTGSKNSLPKRPFGSGGLEITTVGSGAWALGGGGWSYGWGPQDDNASVATLRHALDLGINWIDTAAIYGLGHSEEVVGLLLRELPASERPLIFTKCGLISDEQNRMAEPRRVLKPESIRRECEASLRRLGVERIDLYQFHWPDETGTPVEDSWGEMVRLIKQGKVRLGGVSNFDVQLLERCEAIRHVDSLQAPFSLIRREAAAREIPWCAEHGTGVICYSPMQSGLLTDTFSRERVSKLAQDDWRRRSPEFQEPNLSRNLGLLDALRPIAQRHGTTVSVIAIAWTLAWPGVTGAIVGARSPQQVDGWIDAASVELTAADLKEIAAAIERTGAGSGPMLPQTQDTTEAA
jgi:aryl-alcohol dehydrogenase-like predicted oxidoreductase